MADSMARDDNRGRLSKLRDLRERLASWPAAPLHEQQDAAASLGSAPADAVTPSHSESLAELIEAATPPAVPSAAETTVIRVDGAAPAGEDDGAPAAPSEAATRVLSVAARPQAESEADEPEKAVADVSEPEAAAAADEPGIEAAADEAETAEAEADEPEAEAEAEAAGETDESEGADDDIEDEAAEPAASPLRSVGPVMTSPPASEASAEEEPEESDGEETSSPADAVLPGAAATTVFAAATRPEAVDEPAEEDDDQAASEPAETAETEEEEPSAEVVDEPADEETEPAEAEVDEDAADEDDAAATTVLPVAKPDQALIDTERTELPDATPPTEVIELAPLPPPIEDPFAAPDRSTPEYIAPTTPQTVAPQPKRRSRLPWLIAAAVAVIAVIAAVIGLATMGSSSDDAPSNDPARAATDAVTAFVSAVNKGDLAALREQTCGQAKAYYDAKDDAQFQRVHANAESDGKLPELDGIQAVEVHGDRAQVQVEVHFTGTPTARANRTLTLQKDGNAWKVCTPVEAK